MNHDSSKRNLNLDDAVRAVREDQPPEREIRAAAERVYARLEAAGEEAAVEQIHGCQDVRNLMPAFLAGTLSPARALLVEDHLRECVACRHRAESRPVEDSVPWTAPLPAMRFGFPRRALALVATVVFAALVGVGVYQNIFVVPAGARATLESVDGAVYRVDGNGERLLAVGEQLGEAEVVRTAAGAHAYLRLADRSLVEVNERTTFDVQARGKNMTLEVDEGAVIVQAAKRTSGHLYVRTPDCRVAVTGTVFSVKAGLKGSRVFVVEGQVRVKYAGQTDVLQAGQQVATSPNLMPVSATEEIGWSHDLNKHIELLAQFANLRQQLEQIQMPGLRYSSDLLPRVPAATVVYASIPNAGEALAEANRIFQQQLQQSPALRDWWNQGHAQNNTAEFTEMVEKIRQLSQYLGDEVVLVGVNGRNDPQIALLADLRRSDLRAFLDAQFAPKPGKSDGVVTLDEHELATVTPAMVKGQLLALVRNDVVVFSPELDAMRALNLQLNAGPSGFPDTEFGKRIAAAYEHGTGYMIAVNLQQITQSARNANPHPNERAALDVSGFADARYLVAEHRELNGGASDNHLTLDFAGPRKGVASWLAAPAPMGSLEFISRNAGLTFSVVAKQPAGMMKDIMAMVQAGGHPEHEADVTEQKFRKQFEELLASFGGDATVALDGPVLPTPAWKIVVQVYDPEHLQASLEQLVQQINEEAAKRDHAGIELKSEDVGGQRYFVVRSHESAINSETYYTYAFGYLVAGPSRAVVMNALQTRANGDSLVRAPEFTALLPRDRHANYSAVVYQNLGPILQPVASQLDPEKLPLLQQLMADARPSAICAYGEQTQIEVASNGRLFGYDFITLVSLLHDLSRLQQPAGKL